jgi:hypothetical protein
MIMIRSQQGDARFAASRPGPAGPARRIAAASFVLVILLLTQYVLGIAYNLYGTAPTAAKTLKPFSSPLLGAHVALGTLLIVIAVYLVIASLRAGLRGAVVASAVGLVALIAAWVTGSAFTQQGTAGYSMAMGALTAVALLAYIVTAKASAGS